MCVDFAAYQEVCYAKLQLGVYVYIKTNMNIYIHICIYDPGLSVTYILFDEKHMDGSKRLIIVSHIWFQWSRLKVCHLMAWWNTNG